MIIKAKSSAEELMKIKSILSSNSFFGGNEGWNWAPLEN